MTTTNLNDDEDQVYSIWICPYNEPLQLTKASLLRYPKSLISMAIFRECNDSDSLTITIPKSPQGSTGKFQKELFDIYEYGCCEVPAFYKFKLFYTCINYLCLTKLICELDDDISIFIKMVMNTLSGCFLSCYNFPPFINMDHFIFECARRDIYVKISLTLDIPHAYTCDLENIESLISYSDTLKAEITGIYNIDDVTDFYIEHGKTKFTGYLLHPDYEYGENEDCIFRLTSPKTIYTTERNNFIEVLMIFANHEEDFPYRTDHNVHDILDGQDWYMDIALDSVPLYNGMIHRYSEFISTCIKTKTARLHEYFGIVVKIKQEYILYMNYSFSSETSYYYKKQMYLLHFMK